MTTPYTIECTVCFGRQGRAARGPNFASGSARERQHVPQDQATFDLYCGRVSPSGSLELGNHQLTPGQHRMRFTVAGKNVASTGCLFGVDAIDLLDE
jgi:hypothetical protein